MSNAPALITVAEFERMPEPRGGLRQELRHGKVVQLPPPKPRDSDIQYRILTALNALASPGWTIRSEMPFRPAPEFELWQGDVAVIETARWQESMRADAYPQGAPAIVIEVLSPSNTGAAMDDRRRTCLDGGCREFWTVDPLTREVHVSTPDRLTRTHRAGETIEIPLLGATLTVNDIV